MTKDFDRNRFYSINLPILLKNALAWRKKTCVPVNRTKTMKEKCISSTIIQYHR